MKSISDARHGGRSRQTAKAAPGEEIDDPLAVGRDIMLRALTVRARTRRELAALLAKRGIPEDIAEELLARFAEVALIDDEAFARAWVDSRQQRRSLSSRALAAELAQKGVARETVAEAVAGVDRDAEVRSATELAQRRVARMQGVAEDVRRRRLAGMLARRGFDGGVIAEALAAVELSPGPHEVDWEG